MGRTFNTLRRIREEDGTVLDEEEARALVDRIHAAGKVALVQPYLSRVETEGETALVFLGGALSHVLHKKPVLRDHGVAPLAPGELVVAAAMLEDDLVTAGSADPDQIEFAGCQPAATRQDLIAELPQAAVLGIGGLDGIGVVEGRRTGVFGQPCDRLMRPIGVEEGLGGTGESVRVQDKPPVRRDCP